MTKLTAKEEQLFGKFHSLVEKHLLTEDEVKELRQALELKRSLGVLGIAVVKLAALITAGTLLVQTFLAFRGGK